MERFKRALVAGFLIAAAAAAVLTPGKVAGQTMECWICIIDGCWWCRGAQPVGFDQCGTPACDYCTLGAYCEDITDMDADGALSYPDAQAELDLLGSPSTRPVIATVWGGTELSAALAWSREATPSGATLLRGCGGAIIAREYTGGDSRAIRKATSRIVI
jgi:hypothetical protein